MKEIYFLISSDEPFEIWFHLENSKNLLLYSTFFFTIKNKFLFLVSRFNKLPENSILCLEKFLLVVSKNSFFFFSTKYHKKVFTSIQYISIQSFLYSSDTLYLRLKIKTIVSLVKKTYFNKKFIYNDLYNPVLPSRCDKSLKNLIYPLNNIKQFVQKDFKNFIVIENLLKNIILIWDITSDRIILEIFLNTFNSHSKSLNINHHNSFYLSESYILVKKKKKIFQEWLNGSYTIKFKFNLDFQFSSKLEKYFSTKTLEKRKINKKQLNLTFSFFYFKNLNSRLNLWGKNFQENWITFNSEFRTSNQCRINKRNTIVFLTKF
jgi:hypothetical protein